MRLHSLRPFLPFRQARNTLDHGYGRNNASLPIRAGREALCANDDETPSPFEFRLGHRRPTSWLCPATMDQPTPENGNQPSLNRDVGCLKVIDTFRRAKVPGNNGEIVEVRQVNDMGMRARDADNEGVVVCSRSIRRSIQAPARLFRSHAAMVNVSQDVTPNRASPAEIRIARSSDCPDLAQKANTATQKNTILTREDGDTT